jgi:MFS family permease
MSWLLQFCAARAAFATMFTTWSAALPLLRQEWGLTAGQAGLVQSAYHVGFLVSLFTVGFLTDRYGARRTYLVSSVTAAASALLFAFGADGFASSLILYGITGLCSGGSYTPGLAIISQQVGRLHAGGGQGKALGLYLAAASLGYAIGLLTASLMIPLAGWRGAFIVTALGPVLGMLLHGSDGASGSPFCSSSTEIWSGERTNAMRPSRGGRLMVTPCSCSRLQAA